MPELMIDLDEEVIAEIFPGHQYVGFYHGPGKRLYGGISVSDVETLHNLIQELKEIEVPEEQLEIYYG